MKSRLSLLLVILLTSLPVAQAASQHPPAKKPVPSVRPAAKAVRVATLSNFTFRGNRIGDPGEIVIERMFRSKKTCARLPVSPSPNSSLSLPILDEEPILPSGGDSKWNGEDGDDREKKACLKDLKTHEASECTDYDPGIIENGSTFLTYTFFHRKLSGFRLSFPSAVYFQIEPMLTGKYGKPHTQRIHRVHNRMGAEFEQIVSSWRTPHGPMRLYFRYPTLDSGLLILENSRIQAAIRTKNERELQNKGKSVF